MDRIAIPHSISHLGRLFRGGETWLQDLPQIVQQLCTEWSLQIVQQLESSYHFVAKVQSPGGSAVLKVGCPGEGIDDEMRALGHFQGMGTVALLKTDPELSAMLLEWIDPGTPLSHHFAAGKDDEATYEAANAMLRLTTVAGVPTGAPHIREWNADIEKLRSGDSPIDKKVLDRARAVFEELQVPATEEVLLHGDLHHYNLLQGGDQYVVIDPKGIAGDPVYEVGPLMKNPCEYSGKLAADAELARRRIAILAEVLDYDRERVRLWSFYQAVLSGVWTVDESPDGWHDEIGLAEMLWGLRV